MVICAALKLTFPPPHNYKGADCSRGTLIKTVSVRFSSSTDALLWTVFIKRPGNVIVNQFSGT